MQGCRDVVDEGGQISRPANLVQLSGLVQLLGDGQKIDRHSPFVQTNKGLPDPAVAVNIKVIRSQKLSDFVIGIRVDHHRTKHALFCFARLRDDVRGAAVAL